MFYNLYYFLQLYSGVLLFYNRKYGLRTSGLLFLFWFFFVVFSIPQFRSEIMKEIDRTDPEEVQYPFISYMIFFPLIVLMVLLNCFVDQPPNYSPYPESEVSKK